MFINALIGFFAALGIFVILQWIKGRLYRPLPRSENIHISTVISLSGSAPELEATVKALDNLRKNGALSGEMVLLDRGMDGETALVAEALAQEGLVELRF